MEFKQYSHRLADNNIYYTQAGTGEGILLIHGSLCDYRYWRWQIDNLSINNQIIAPSLRGCWPDNAIHPLDSYNVEQHAQDLIDLIKAIKPHEKIHILGHSRGAQIAIQIALIAPEICASLILADPGFRFSDEPETKPFYAEALLLLRRGLVDEALELFVDQVNGASTWKKMVPWFKEMATDNAMTLLSQIEEANFAFTPEQVQSIKSPVLLINGKNSPKKYIGRTKRINELLPAAESSQIALASHGMNLANPRSFNRVILGFTDKLQDTKRERFNDEPSDRG